MRARMRAAGVVAASALSLLADGAEAKDWTQVYVGAAVGADVVSTEIDVSLAGLAEVGADDLGTGAFGGSLRLGADYQANHWLVVGAFANIDWSDAETKLSAAAGGLGLTLDLLGIERAWTVGARAGMLATPDTLSYLLVGYTQVDFSDITISGGLAPALKVPEGKGVVVGSGFEHRVTPNVSLTGEYRASYLDEETLFAIPGLVDVSTETVLHTGRIGVAYRFGGGASDAAAVDRPASSWTGLYGGIGTGVSGVDGEVDVATPLFGGIAANGEGLVGGDYGGSLMIGYDHRIAPKWVAGVFAAVDKTLQESEITASALGLSAGVDLPILDELYTVAARAGYLVSSETLLYGLVGYARLEMTDLDVAAAGIPLFSFSMPTFEGVTYGGGIETQLGRGFSLRAEYRYADLGEETLFDAGGFTATADADVHTTRVFLNYRFDREESVASPLK